MSLIPKTTKGITREPAECMFMFYGPPGIGKTEAASTFPNALFVSTTRGLGWVDVKEARVDSWDEFLELVEEIEEGNHDVEVIVFDLIKDLYDMCVEWTMEELLDGNHPSSFEWGKGWGAVGKEFRRAISGLMNLERSDGLGYGMIFIAHETTREVKTKMFKLDKIIPKLSKGTFEWFYGILDFVVYMRMVDARDPESKKITSTRVMALTPSVEFEAKSWAGKATSLPGEIDFEDQDVYDLISGFLDSNPKKSRKTSSKTKKAPKKGRSKR